MRSKIVYIFIGALLILIIGYFIFQSLSKKESLLLNVSSANINESANLNSTASTNSSEILNTNTTDMQPQNANRTVEIDPDAVLFDKAYTAGDRAICEQIKSESSKLLCGAYIIDVQAKTNKDPKLCDEIKDDFYRTGCHDNVIIFLAKQDKNKERCNELIDKKRFEECAAGTR